MAAWRTKACEAFGFQAGTYSTRWGVNLLLSDLFGRLERASIEGDADLLARIVEYVLWVDSQSDAENLRSAADIAFFVPLLSRPELCRQVHAYMPASFLEAKRDTLPKDA